MDKITADVAIQNLNSIKILEKFMTAKKEFFNELDNCTDRRYEVLKNNWLKKGIITKKNSKQNNKLMVTIGMIFSYFQIVTHHI